MKQTVMIKGEAGLHARPSTLLTKEANQYQANVELVYGDVVINAKSILGVLSLGVKCNTEITIQASGVDAEDAVKGIVNVMKEANII